MDLTGLITMLAIGAIAGWLAGKLMEGADAPSREAAVALGNNIITLVLEAMGFDTAPVLMPQHVMLLVDTGVPSNR